MRVMRKVVEIYRSSVTNSVPGATRLKLILECGHTTYQKGSIKVPKRTNCRECVNPSTWGK